MALGEQSGGQGYQAATGAVLVSMWLPGREKSFSCPLSHYSMSPFTWSSGGTEVL